MNPIVIAARATANPGQEEKLNLQLIKLVEATSHQQGVLIYDLHRSTDNPAQFLMYEHYATQSALDAHIASEPLQHFFSLVPQFVEGKVEILPFSLVSSAFPHS